MDIQVQSEQMEGPNSDQNSQNIAKPKTFLTNWPSLIIQNLMAWQRQQSKIQKSLVIRFDEANEDLRQAIAAWRNMVQTDRSSPAQMFFNRTQKQGLPLLNPNAKPFDPEGLIKRRDKLHEQQIKLRDQHSMVIEDLAPGQEVLTQDYLSGLWKESAVVLSKRDDGILVI